MGRNYLAGETGDATNAILTAAGYNVQTFLVWLRLFLRALLATIEPEKSALQSEVFAFSAFFTAD
jgi:IS5 family transposase